MHEQLKDIPFEFKQLSDDGDFVGIASVYGNIDLGNDVVDPGAFDESIAKNGSKVRLMDSHKVRIGVATVETTPQGLKATGKINTKKQSGMEALSDLRFYRDNGMPMGMSIGYETIDADRSTKDGARHLKKVRLWEVTITEFPMNTSAQVTSVKSIRDLIASVKARQGRKDSFEAELESIQLYAARYQMLSALSDSLSSIIYDAKVEDKIAASAESIEQFRAAYLGMLPDYIALLNERSMGWMSVPGFENKAGRVLSQSNRDLIGRCIKDLQDLLDAADADKALPVAPASPPTGDEAKTALSLIEEIRANL